METPGSPVGSESEEPPIREEERVSETPSPERDTKTETASGDSAASSGSTTPNKTDSKLPEPLVRLWHRQFWGRHYWLFSYFEWVVIGLVLAMAAATRLPGLSEPVYIVFDEVHFGGFISDYLRGTNFFDIHPPLAKLIMAGAAKRSRYRGQTNFSRGGRPYGKDKSYVGMRRCPAMHSTFVPPLLTASLLLLRVPLGPSFLAGFLLTFEFTAIVQARIIVTDGIQYFFICVTIFFVSLYTRRPTWPVIFLQGIAAGCSLSCKFTGLCVLAVIGAAHFAALFPHRRRANWVAHLLFRGMVIGLLAIAVLFVTMYIHLVMLPKPGHGDEYTRDIRGFRQLPKIVKIPLLLWRMFTQTRTLRSKHIFQSKWYTWPFSAASPLIVHSRAGKYLLLFNNPVVAFLAFAGFLVAALTKNYLFAIGYVAAYAPFALVSRSSWTYHYEIALIFGVLALCQSIGHMTKWSRRFVCTLIGAATLAAFALFYPWVYYINKEFTWHERLMIWKKLKDATGIVSLARPRK
jgi:dolichyl-phosphate-mannose--protein O-mannosyl transferase